MTRTERSTIENFAADSWRVVALIIVATVAVYLPAINGGFLLDDDERLTENPLVHAPDGLYRAFTFRSPDPWPVSTTSFWLEWRIWGLKSFGYHLTNVALHIGVSLLVWLILSRLRIPGAVWAALLFAVHPVNVEAVAWIAQRKTLLATAFCLLSMLWFIKADDAPHGKQSPGAQSSRWYWLSLAAFVLGMLSKGSIAILPLLLLGIAWWRRNRVVAADWARIAPFLLIAGVGAAVNVWFQTHGAEEVRSAGFAERLAGAGVVPWFYLLKAVLPIDLIFVYPRWDIQTGKLLWWLPLAASIATTAILWRRRRSWWGRPLLFAWGFYCVSLAPVIGFSDAGFARFSLVADHYQYLAIMAVVALMAAAWNTWYEQAQGQERWIALGVGGLMVGVFMILAWRQSLMYRSAKELWETTIRRNPECWLAYDGLGTALLSDNQPQQAAKEFEQAIKLNPDFPEAHKNASAALALIGRSNEAIAQGEEALRLRPNYADAHVNLGKALLDVGRLEEALAHFDQAVQIRPDIPEAHYDRGVALHRAGRTTEAIAQFEEALRLRPDYAEAHGNLGVILFQEGQLPEAVRHCEEALRLNPNYAEAHNVLGAALASAGQLDAASKHFAAVVELKPDYAEAWFNLAVALSGVQRSSDAAAAAQRALALARSQGQTAMVQEVEAWLNSLQGGPTKQTAPTSGSHLPPSP